jgi:hypothetical protein
MTPNAAGQYFNIWTKDELDSIVEVMQEIPFTAIRNNQCRGIDENNVEYFWFIDTVYNRIQKLFDQDIKLVFGMLLHEEVPWGIHTDAYHCSKFPDRESALSILIPYSLDNSVENLDQGYTLVFNEWTTTNDSILQLPDQDNSAVSIYQEHLSHNPLDVVKKLTVKGIYQWQLGSVIYWDSRLLHDSNNFLRYGLSSKQAIVIHTYRDKNK